MSWAGRLLLVGGDFCFQGRSQRDCGGTLGGTIVHSGETLGTTDPHPALDATPSQKLRTPFHLCPFLAIKTRFHGNILLFLFLSTHQSSGASSPPLESSLSAERALCHGCELRGGPGGPALVLTRESRTPGPGSATS